MLCHALLDYLPRHIRLLLQTHILFTSKCWDILYLVLQSPVPLPFPVSCLFPLASRHLTGAWGTTGDLTGNLACYSCLEPTTKWSLLSLAGCDGCGWPANFFRSDAVQIGSASVLASFLCFALHHHEHTAYRRHFMCIHSTESSLESFFIQYFYRISRVYLTSKT